ncbi:hypothetical protein E2C01_027903 [Portunus trituberculatus]|uniref:Secreted protein n=1 Tax=Portunus trituberculatus TaxID=210409 RepID=A0A5B7EJB3_PORTR|nr:hypothetical protein [Portunus trituberculatus]
MTFQPAYLHSSPHQLLLHLLLHSLHLAATTPIPYSALPTFTSSSSPPEKTPCRCYSTPGLVTTTIITTTNTTTTTDRIPASRL